MYFLDFQSIFAESPQAAPWWAVRFSTRSLQMQRHQNNLPRVGMLRAFSGRGTTSCWRAALFMIDIKTPKPARHIHSFEAKPELHAMVKRMMAREGRGAFSRFANRTLLIALATGPYAGKKASLAAEAAKAAMTAEAQGARL